MFFLMGCGDDFLDKSPIIGDTSENFYQSEEDARAAVNAAYASLQYELTPAGHFRWFWGDVMSDDSQKGGSGDNDAFGLLLLETFQGQANDEHIASEWTASFEGIYRANVVLENIPNIDMDETIKSQVLGEARFIRSYFFFNLVTMFGDVPKADHVLAPSEYSMPRSPASEIWDIIIDDLTQAIDVLPLRSELSSNEIGRITKGAARGLLTKAYLWNRNYLMAEQTANDIIISGEYMLADDYASIFTTAGENGPGSVFEVQYMNASGGNWGYNAQNEGTFTNVFQRARGQFNGYGFNLPTQDLVDEFFAENPNVEDPRLSATLFRVGDEMGDRGVFTKEATGGFPHDYYPKKYFDNQSETAPFGDPNPNGGSNDRVIRYADVLLMHAEAAYHNNNEGPARTSLNLVRERARGGNASILPDVTASGQALLDAIYHERRVELAMEGHRFFDLVRTGRAATVLGPLGYQDGVHNLFPIPESQILVTNGAITQNPGY